MPTRLFFAAFLVLTSIRCGGNSDDTSTSIRVVSAIALSSIAFTAPAFDIYIDDGEKPWISGLAYAKPSDSIAVAAGKHTLKVVAAGDALANLRGENEITVNEGERHLVVLQGNGVSADDGTASLPDQFVDLPVSFAKADAGSARVRFAFTSSENFGDIGGNVGAFVSFDVGRDGADALVTSLTGAETPVAAGTEAEVVVTASGSFDLGGYVMPALEDGRSYYAVYMGSFLVVDAAAQRYRLLLIPADGGEVIPTRSETAVYVMNAVLDAPGNIQFKIDGGVVANDLAYRRLTGPFFRRSGQMTAQLLVGLEIPVVDFSTLTTEGEQLAIVAGAILAGADDPALKVIKPTPGDFAPGLSHHFRVINAADLGNLDFALKQGGNIETPLASNLAFGESTNPPGVSVSAAGDVLIRAAGGMTEIASLDDGNGIASGFPFSNDYIIAVGSKDANTPPDKAPRLIDVNANLIVLND